MKVKALQATLLRWWLSVSTKYQQEHIPYLAEAIKKFIHVWPQSIPSESFDRTDRWWRVIDSPETTSFRSTMQWIKEKLPLTFDTCPGLKMVSLTNPTYLKYWNIFEVLLEK
jgi:hypothetical protein